MTFFAAFILGLAGSLHCAAMCGPLTLALGGARRGSGGWPWLHHGGRLATYLLLGAVCGGAGAVFLWAGMQRWLSMLAGAVTLLIAFQLLTRGAAFGSRFALWIKGKFGGLVRSRSIPAAIGLGALNGLLPCGLVYLACAAAAAASSVTAGMGTMLAFGLGTAPMLFGIHFAGRLLPWGGPSRWRRLVLVFAALAGGLLILRGMSLGIPYVSPSLDGKSCCVIHSLAAGNSQSLAVSRLRR